MIYLSLDQAMQTTGVAVFNNEKLVYSGTFSIPGNYPIERRLGTFWEKLNDLYAEYEFEYVFFEGIQYQNNAETFKKLSYVQSAILLWCYFNSLKFEIISPSSWRSTLKENFGIKFGKSREEQKQIALAFAREHFGEVKSSDAADAICLGVAGRIMRGHKESAW